MESLIINQSNNNRKIQFSKTEKLVLFKIGKKCNDMYYILRGIEANNTGNIYLSEVLDFNHLFKMVKVLPKYTTPFKKFYEIFSPLSNKKDITDSIDQLLDFSNLLLEIMAYPKKNSQRIIEEIIPKIPIYNSFFTRFDETTKTLL